MVTVIKLLKCRFIPLSHGGSQAVRLGIVALRDRMLAGSLHCCTQLPRSNEPWHGGGGNGHSLIIYLEPPPPPVRDSSGFAFISAAFCLAASRLTFLCSAARVCSMKLS